MDHYTKRMERLTKKKIAPTVLRIFSEIDLRRAHNGLGEIAKKHKVNIDFLHPGEFVVFINFKMNAVKILTVGNVLIHLKSGTNEPIEMATIQALPKLFDGREFNFSAAVKRGLKKAA